MAQSNSSGSGKVVKPPHSLASQNWRSSSWARSRVRGEGLKMDSPGEDMNESTSKDWAKERCDRVREGEEDTVSDATAGRYAGGSVPAVRFRDFDAAARREPRRHTYASEGCPS